MDSYLVLLRAGFTLPRLLPGARCALTAPFHPYLRIACAVSLAVYFLWHFPWACAPQALPGALILWSPDFPPATDRKDRLPATAWPAQHTLYAGTCNYARPLSDPLSGQRCLSAPVPARREQISSRPAAAHRAEQPGRGQVPYRESA